MGLKSRLMCRPCFVLIVGPLRNDDMDREATKPRRQTRSGNIELMRAGGRVPRPSLDLVAVHEVLGGCECRQVRQDAKNRQEDGDGAEFGDV